MLVVVAADRVAAMFVAAIFMVARFVAAPTVPCRKYLDQKRP